MPHLLDSDICIDLLRKTAGPRRDFYRSLLTDAPMISVISYGEVTEGVRGSPLRERDEEHWQRLLAVMGLLDVTRDVADVCASLREHLRRRGELIPDADLLIAATALGLGLPLVSRNERHFRRIAGLRLVIPPR